MVFKIDVESNFIDYSNLTVAFDSSINFTIKDLFIIFDCQATTTSTEFFLDGESLLIIPFKKGEDEKKYLRALNNPDISGISMGEGSVLGMAINDIPPSILALASRALNNSNKIQTQTLNDILSSLGISFIFLRFY